MTAFLAVALIFQKLFEMVETPIDPIYLFLFFSVLAVIFRILIFIIWRKKMRHTTYGLIFVVFAALALIIIQELVYPKIFAFLIILLIILVLLAGAGKLYVER